jgi:hypothetical protein
MKLFLALPKSVQDKYVKGKDANGEFISKAMVINGEQLTYVAAPSSTLFHSVV